jgi:hypothetical protein
MQFITSDGVSLEYTDQGHGMPVVITTGYAGFKEYGRNKLNAC